MGWFQNLVERIGFGQKSEEVKEPEGEQKLREVREKLQHQEDVKYQQLLTQNAISDVQHVIGRLYFEERNQDGVLESFRYSEVSRPHKIWHLRRSVDWEGYVNAGMNPEVADRIIVNAAENRPPEEWQEPRTGDVRSYAPDPLEIKRGEWDRKALREADIPPRGLNPLDQIRQTVRTAAKAQGHNKGKEAEPEL